jgi:hypothetical protein
MSKQYGSKKQSKVASDGATNSSQSSGSSSSSSSREKSSKESSSSGHKYFKPKVDMLSHNGITSTNIHSWCHSLSSPEVFGSLDLKTTWSSSPLKEGTDATKIKLPPLVGGEPVRPVPTAD